MPLPAVIGGLSAFAQTPLGQMIMSQLATSVFGNLFGGGSSPYDQAAQQQMGIGKTLIPQLQQQAAGMPTAATRAQGNYLNQQVTRNMQSTAASASRAMPSGRQYGQTAPARAAQNRLQGARIEGMANIMGQSQMNAQNQLSQLYQGGMASQAGVETANLAARTRVGQQIGQIMALMGDGQANEQDTELYNMIKNWLKETIGTPSPQAPTQSQSLGNFNLTRPNINSRL